MLSVRAGLTPDNRTGGVRYTMPGTIHAFTITLHIAVLKLSSHAVHVLIVRQNSLRLRTKKVDLPNAQQAHQYRYVFIKRGASEILINSMCAIEQLFKIVVTNCKSD